MARVQLALNVADLDAAVDFYTKLFSESFDPPATFTLVACLALMAILLNETVRRAEKRASFWRNEGANEK